MIKMSEGFRENRSSALNGGWRSQIEANLKRASAQRVRALFEEMNPHLANDKTFESRWTNKRKDAAVLIPIIDRPKEPTVLLTVRSADMPSHAGQISFPGGKIHPDDESPVHAALREAEEEVGIPRDKVDVIGTLGLHLGGVGFSVTPVIGVIAPAVELRPCPREVAEIFEAPLSFFVDPKNHIVEERELQGVKYNMFAAPYGRYHIWGLTAGILRSLAEILREGE
ncbi:MAG: CoA pyrophosphatase [Alphaproteobacteria bacterium]|nr:CoA pyrophosphatase [Alphaproteobacteria bacterium]